MADSFGGNKTDPDFTFVEVGISPEDQERLDSAEAAAESLLKTPLEELTPPQKALLMTAFCTDVYARERVSADGAVGLTMGPSSETLPPVPPSGSPNPEEYQQDAILQALREAFFDLESQADPNHTTTYAYYKILRLKQVDDMPRRAVFVAKGTDTGSDWTGQNIWVNGRLANCSPHLMESTTALLNHFIQNKDDQFEYWLTGHSLAGHLVQQLSAMIYGLAHCDLANDYLVRFSTKYGVSADELQDNCKVLFSKITAVWAVDPPGTHHIINSFLSRDFGLDSCTIQNYMGSLGNHMTVVGRVNLVNRLGKQLLNPYVITSPYFSGDAGYPLTVQALSDRVKHDLQSIHGNTDSHSVRDMMNILYPASQNLGLVKFEGEWGDGSNWTSLARVGEVVGAWLASPVFHLVGELNRLVCKDAVENRQEDVDRVKGQLEAERARLEKAERARQAERVAETLVTQVIDNAKQEAKRVSQLEFNSAKLVQESQGLGESLGTLKERLSKLEGEQEELAREDAERARQEERFKQVELFNKELLKAKREAEELRTQVRDNAKQEVQCTRSEEELAREDAVSNFSGSKLLPHPSGAQTGQRQGPIVTSMGAITSVSVGLGLGFGLPSFAFAGSASAGLFTVGSFTVTAGLLSVVGVAVLSGLVVGAVAYSALNHWNRQQMSAEGQELSQIETGAFRGRSSQVSDTPEDHFSQEDTLQLSGHNSGNQR